MGFYRKKLLIFATVVITSASIAISGLKAQTTQEQVIAERSQLQQELADLEKEIASYQNQLKNIKGQKNTLSNKIAALKKQQDVLNTQVKISTLQLTDINALEVELQKSVDGNEVKIKELQAQMRRLIDLLNKEDGHSFIYTILLSNTLSQAFSARSIYDRLMGDLGHALGQLQKTRIRLKDDIKTLEAKREDKRNIIAIKALQQRELTGSVSEQNNLLAKTKGEESAYQAQLTDTQKEAAAIKNRLYQLLEVSKQITFGQAVGIANWASSQTGVRAAFLLAVLTQESNLGANVGTCNRAGDPPSKSWKAVMKPTRDQEPFKQITSELGLNIDTTPISCPMRDKSGNQVGWGGAMGPAQFIPSTWMGYRAKVTAITGKPANPWDIRDAFLAAALLLKANGASTQNGEWAAAMRFFSGGTNPAYSFYGDSVVSLTADYASDIEKLK